MQIKLDRLSQQNALHRASPGISTTHWAAA
jgi:hypothetical protein